jgi:hypothetical protein
LLGLRGKELAKHVALASREVAAKKALEQQAEAERERIAKLKEMRSEAERLKESLQSPVQGLAADFASYEQYYRAGLISAQQYAVAKTRAAKQLTDVPDNINTQSLDLRGTYNALVEEQNERRKERLEQAQTQRMIAAATKLAAHQQKRLAVNQQITQQMAQQAKFAGQMSQTPQPGQSQPSGGNTAGGSSDATLDRIADATESTAAAINQWELSSY